MIELSSLQRDGSLYIVYDLTAHPHPIDNNSVMMINSNQKRSIGLAKISFDEINGQKQRILFDVTGMMPLSEFKKYNQTQESYRQFILAIINSIESFEEYMISVDQVILNPDYVYINIVEKNVNFLCLPFADGAGSGCDLYEFFSKIWYANVSLKEGEVSYYNLVNNVLSSKSSFSLDNLRKVLMPESMKKTAEAPPINRPDSQITIGGPVDGTGDIEYPPETGGMYPISGTDSDGGFFPVPPKPEEPEEEEGGFFAKLLSLLPFGKKNADKNAEDDADIDISGGLAGLTDGKPKPKPKPQPKPQPEPRPLRHEPKPAPKDTDEDLSHTIIVPSAAPSSDIGGLGGLTDRENRTQMLLFGDQPNGRKNAVAGGMTGMQQEGLRQPQPQDREPETVYGPPPADHLTDSSNEPTSDPLQVFYGPPSFDENEPRQDAPRTGLAGLTQPPQKPAPDPEDDPKTELITDGDTRTVRMKHAWLISRRDGAHIDLDKPLMRVGRNRPDIDIDLRHNVHVGHYHATLLRVDGEFVVIDEHSANHTYVNHQQVKPDEKPEDRTVLKDGDLVIFGDEAFEYHIEQ